MHYTYALYICTIHMHYTYALYCIQVPYIVYSDTSLVHNAIIHDNPFSPLRVHQLQTLHLESRNSYEKLICNDNHFT